MARITKTPEERRQEIIDTAMKVFYEKGYEKTSISDIAKEMNVAQGLCYRYFPSKEVLFDNALDQYAQRQAEHICRILQEKHNTLTDLIEKMPTFIETEREDSYAQKICHEPGNMKIHNQLSLKICAKMHPIVTEQLTLANERGEIHIQDPYSTASFCVYGQLGILLDQNTSAEKKVKKIKAFLLDLIKRY